MLQNLISGQWTATDYLYGVYAFDFSMYEGHLESS